MITKPNSYWYFDASHVLDFVFAGGILIGWNNHVILYIYPEKYGRPMKLAIKISECL